MKHKAVATTRRLCSLNQGKSWEDSLIVPFASPPCVHWRILCRRLWLDSVYSDRYLFICSDGELAQLGERLHGMQEVRGSSPLFSILWSSWISLGQRFLAVPTFPNDYLSKRLSVRLMFLPLCNAFGLHHRLGSPCVGCGEAVGRFFLNSPSRPNHDHLLSPVQSTDRETHQSARKPIHRPRYVPRSVSRCGVCSMMAQVDWCK